MSENNSQMRTVNRLSQDVELKEVLMYVLSQWYIIVAAVLVVAIGVGIYYFAFVPDEYTAQATLYVRNQVNEQYISSSDLTGSAMLTYDYKELIKSRTVTSRACDTLGLNSLNGYKVNVDSVTNTRFIKISVTGPYPESVTRIANTLAEVFSETVLSVMEVDNVSIVDTAEVPDSPSGPSRLKYMAIAGLITGLITFGILVAVDLLNTSIRTAEDIEEQLGIQVLAQVAIVKSEGKEAGK